MIFPITETNIYTCLRILIKLTFICSAFFSFSNSLAFDFKDIAKNLSNKFKFDIRDISIPYLMEKKQYDEYCNHLFVDTKLNLEKMAYYKFFQNDEEFQEYLVNTPWLPLSLENSLGSVFLSKIKGKLLSPEEYKFDYKILNQETSLIISSLKENFNGQVPINFKFFIYDSQERNAFSLPGGYIFVSKRLIDDVKVAHILKLKNKERKSRNVLDFILAHEVSHNLKRHYTYHLQELILNGIYDSNNFNEIQGFIKSFHFWGQSTLAERDEELKFLLNRILFYLDKSIQVKRKSLLHLTIFEKEADACAVRILLTKKSFSDVKQIINDVFDNQINIAYFNYKNNDLGSIALAKKTVDRIRRILEFYLSSPVFVHPNYRERKKVLMRVLLYWRTRNEN